MNLSKVLRTKLPKYKVQVLDKLKGRFQFLNELIPYNDTEEDGTPVWEVDGFQIRVTSKPGNSDRSIQQLKLIMEKNTDHRILNVVKRQDKIWVTLHHNRSQFKSNLCRVINEYVKNLRKYFQDVVIEKIDFKVDSKGSYQVCSKKRQAKAF